MVTQARLDDWVDEAGWRPSEEVVPGPVPPGVAGAVQSQRNLVAELGHFPHALNLRRVLHAQAVVSRAASAHASTAAPDLVARFNDRAEVYREMVRSSRSLGGLVGDGGHAVVQSQNAAASLSCPPAAGDGSDGNLRELARLFMSTDARIAATIEHGLDQRLYLVAVTAPGLAEEHVHGVHPVQRRWLPAPEPVGNPLRELVAGRLRPPHRVPTQPSSQSAHDSRTRYEAVLAHEISSRQRGASPSL
jgi:hypothetical protein